MSFEIAEKAKRPYSPNDIEDDEESQGLLGFRQLVNSRKLPIYSFPHIIALYVSNAVLLVLVIMLLRKQKSLDPGLGVWCTKPPTLL
jgi:hypothetical protein